MQKIILASSSPARKQLLERLKIPFEVVKSDVDETPLPHEPIEELVTRLAEQKARVIAKKYPQAIIIGCDQMLTVNGEIMGKPRDHQDAIQQLMKMSGQRVISLTALCVLNAATNKVHNIIERYDVIFRTLTHEMIINYLQRDQPYQCAGSLKAESLGIVLFEAMEGRDPNALIGLPLIALTTILQQEKINLLNPSICG